MPWSILLRCIKPVVGIKMIFTPELKESEFAVFTVLLASVAVCAGALVSMRTASAPQMPRQRPGTQEKC